MLRALETYLLPSLTAALPAAVELVHGPFTPGAPWAPARRVVDVHALRLDVHDVPSPPTIDRPAFWFQSTTWPIDGVASSFTLPPALVGEIVEVEAPLGYLAEPGNDYYLDGTTIRFFRVPTGPGQVRARVRVDAAAGHARRESATITLDVSAFSQSLDTADPLLVTALQIVLVQLEHAPYFALPEVVGLGTSVRFTNFRSHLRHIQRTPTDYASVISCAARLELVGELDLLVVTGPPLPIDVISQIEGEVVVEHPGDDESEPLEIIITDETEA